MRWRAAETLRSAFSQVPNEEQAWQELFRLTRDKDRCPGSYEARAHPGSRNGDTLLRTPKSGRVDPERSISDFETWKLLPVCSARRFASRLTLCMSILIVYKANLNFKNVEVYLNWLIDRELIMKEGKIFKITSKGSELLSICRAHLNYGFEIGIILRPGPLALSSFPPPLPNSPGNLPTDLPSQRRP
jgi:hypothetical protein